MAQRPVGIETNTAEHGITIISLSLKSSTARGWLWYC